jgi:hypothetical protein
MSVTPLAGNVGAQRSVQFTDGPLHPTRGRRQEKIVPTNIGERNVIQKARAHENNGSGPRNSP